jgi:hypothetical protein
MYMVQWKGYEREEEWTEEPFDSFVETECLRKFHRKFPDKPKDNRLRGFKLF